ncbi:MAG: PfkB family carbohydrate kinase [Pseudomonadota bacterium]
MTSNIISVGHAAWDRVYRIENFPIKPTKLRALEYVESGGGMAANAASTIARLGGKVELWSRVGNDLTGHKIRNALKQADVDIRYVEIFDEGRSSSAAVIVDREGERIVIGIKDSAMPTGTSWLPVERINSARLVLADLKWMEAVRIVFARARQVNVPTVLDVDVGNRKALPEILSLTDFAIFSEEALANYLPEFELQARLDRIMLLGPRHAGVTLGKRGYVWRDKFGGGQCPAFEVDVVDTTGAGDAFHGAFALALTEQRPISECARFAAAVAALKCMSLGSRTGLPSRVEVNAFLEQPT